MVGLAVAVGAFLVVTQPLVHAIPSTPPAVDPVLLQAHVKRLSSDFYPRSYDQFRKIGRAAAYIQTSFQAMGATVGVQDVVVQESTYHNVIAHFGPADGPLLVIGAHYDSHSDAHVAIDSPLGYSAQTHTPGADDNASGVAGLIELGRLLSKAQPRRSIQLVAYTLEEPPHFRTEHMGSAWHARSLVKSGREVEMMLSMEMIGFFSDAPHSQRYLLPGMSYLYPDQGNFIALVGRLGDFGAMRKLKAAMSGATALPVLSINAPPWVPGIDFSDHVNYWDAAMPAVMVTDTAFMRNPHYHTAGDTVDTLDYERMAKVVQAVFAYTQMP